MCGHLLHWQSSAVTWYAWQQHTLLQVFIQRLCFMFDLFLCRC